MGRGAEHPITRRVLIQAFVLKENCLSCVSMACERIDPKDFPEEPISLDHYARYVFAGQFARGRRVVDVACGLGYGSSYLAAAGAAQVLGLDVSLEAIRGAEKQYADGRIEFHVCDAHEMSSSAQGIWDLVVSFETIEHLADPLRFLAECRKVLGPSGILVASVPNEAQDPPGANEFHLQHFDNSAFDRLLRTEFAYVDVVPQYFALASVIHAHDYAQVGQLNAAEGSISGSGGAVVKEPDCFIALCSNHAIAAEVRSVLVHGRKLWEHHLSLEQAKAWLEGQMINFQARAAELETALEHQKQYSGELAESGRWLEEQRAKWEHVAVEASEQVARQADYINDLERSKARLDEQRAHWEQTAKRLLAQAKHERSNSSN